MSIVHPKYRVVPVTGTRGEGALYPELSPGKSGRVRRLFGRVSKHELKAIGQGLELFLGLTADS